MVYKVLSKYMFESAMVHPSMATKRRVPCAARSRHGTHRIGLLWWFFVPPTRNQINVGNVCTFFHTIFWPVLSYKRLPPALTGSRFFEYRLMPQGSNFLSFTWTFHRTSTLLPGSMSHKKGCQMGNGQGKKRPWEELESARCIERHRPRFTKLIWNQLLNILCLSIQNLPFNPTCNPFFWGFRKLQWRVISFHI